MLSKNPKPRIFICYAHKDNESTEPSQRWLDRLLEQLEPLNLQEQAEIWSDKKLEIGDEWHEEIQATLQQAKAAVLLVSPAFLASKYIRNSELPVLLKQAKDKKQGVQILPIILRACLFNETKFKYPDPKDGPEELSLSTLQVANSPTTPLNSMAEHEQDKVLLSVAQRLLKIVNPSPENAPKSEATENNKREQFSAKPSEIQPPPTILTLDNVQKKKLRAALMSAFPNESDLEMMLDDELEIALNTIAGGKNYITMMRNVVAWFESQGRLQDLLQAAFRTNPGNPQLKEFTKEVGLADV